MLKIIHSNQIGISEIYIIKENGGKTYGKENKRRKKFTF